MNKRKIMILVILLVIGFASINTTLIINGAARISSNEDDFDVIFTSATINGEGSTVTIDETKKKITFTSSKLTSVGEKTILDYKIKNNSTQYDADVTINCTNDASEYITVTNTLADEEIIEDYKITFNAQEVKSGSITAELIKSATKDTDSVAVTCTIVASATERDEVAESVCIPETYEKGVWKYKDNDCSGDITKGDLATIDTESFYVYDIEEDNIKAIAQFNLYVNGQINDSSYKIISLENPTGLQNYQAIGFTSNGLFPWVGTVPFTTIEKYNSSREVNGVVLNKNDYSISTIKEYVDLYADKLKKMNSNVNLVRLITKEELENAGCDSVKKTCKTELVNNSSFIGTPEYLYSTSYWTYSPVDGNDSYTWFVASDGGFGNDGVYSERLFGVRPVVEISKSLFE